MIALSARSTGLAERSGRQELADLRDEGGELRGQLDVLGDALGVVGDDLLGGLRLGDRVVALDQLLKRDDVDAFVMELLAAASSSFLRKTGHVIAAMSRAAISSASVFLRARIGLSTGTAMSRSSFSGSARWS